MPSPDTITVSQLLRLVGTPEAPVIIDVRTADDFEADPRLIPGAVRRDWQTVRNWAAGHGCTKRALEPRCSKAAPRRGRPLGRRS
jgi:rhodanese-related sulfurtransferase